MTTTIPRYEYRAFAPNFGLIEPRMRSLAPPPQIRESAEVYIVGAGLAEHNIKIREELLDIKQLLKTSRRLEQWTVAAKLALPVAVGDLATQVLPLLGIDQDTLSLPVYSAEEFLREVVQPAPGLVAVQVFKRRFGFRIADCMCELAEVTVNGAAIQTAAVEAENADHALQVISDLGLDAYENTSYSLALRRVVGLAPLGG